MLSARRIQLSMTKPSVGWKSRRPQAVDANIGKLTVKLETRVKARADSYFKDGRLAKSTRELEDWLSHHGPGNIEFPVASLQSLVGVSLEAATIEVVEKSVKELIEVSASHFKDLAFGDRPRAPKSHITAASTAYFLAIQVLPLSEKTKPLLNETEVMLKTHALKENEYRFAGMDVRAVLEVEKTADDFEHLRTIQRAIASLDSFVADTKVTLSATALAVKDVASKAIDGVGEALKQDVTKVLETQTTALKSAYCMVEDGEGGKALKPWHFKFKGHSLTELVKFSESNLHTIIFDKAGGSRIALAEEFQSGGGREFRRQVGHDDEWSRGDSIADRCRHRGGAQASRGIRNQRQGGASGCRERHEGYFHEGSRHHLRQSAQFN